MCICEYTCTSIKPHILKACKMVLFSCVGIVMLQPDGFQSPPPPLLRVLDRGIVYPSRFFVYVILLGGGQVGFCSNWLSIPKIHGSDYTESIYAF